jgi:uncharacterized tellurite resistance protein B-like protein
MGTLVPDKRHPALDVEEPERADYLCVVASMVFADHEVDDREIERVRELCRHLELGEESTERVIETARSEDSAALDAILDRLKGGELRYALMVDAIDVAFADDKLAPEEVAEIDALAERLDISHAQVALIRRYVADRRNLPNDAVVNKDVAAGLAGAGIPIATLALAKTLGFPIVAGVGLAAALGVGSYVSVKKLFSRAAKKRERALTPLPFEDE